MGPGVIVGGSAVAAFLLGAVPFGLLVGRSHGVDVRKVGSGNIGAANVGRALGFRWGALVFVLDMLKGLAATAVSGWGLPRLAAMQQVSEPGVAMCVLGVGLAAIFGHNYSPFLGFRGGKGVATSLGVAFGVFPDLTVAAFSAFGVWCLCVAVWRYSSLGSIAAACVFPLVVWLWLGREGGGIGPRWPNLGFSIFVAILVIVRHRTNISRLLDGSEAKLGSGNRSR